MSAAPLHPPRIVVAGGGVAGLEACLALRSFLDERQLGIDLLCRDGRFEYRPLSVLEPFEGAPAWSMSLERFAADQDVVLVRDDLAAVEADERIAVSASARRLRYDKLLVAVGTRPQRTLPGAITFRGSRDADTLRAALDAVRPGERTTIVFTALPGVFWTLPLYELALLSAARLRARGARARVVLAVPEAAPLALFGPAASAAVRRALDEQAIEFVGRARSVAADAGELELDGGERIPAATIVALASPIGRRILGVPHDGAGFVPVDAFGRVTGLDGVFAAGDVTTFPLKQGGLATQQADAAAECMLAELGFPIVARPFEPILRGVLYADGDPTYLRATHGDESPPRAYSMWWPPSKIAGRHLAPYLATRAGAPRAPEVRPDRDAIAVDVDVHRAVRAVADALDPDAVPGG